MNEIKTLNDIPIMDEIARSAIEKVENRLANNEKRLDGLADIVSGAHADNWETVSKITSSGNARAAFAIGEQLSEEWTDNRSETSTVYSAPMNVAHFSDSELDENGNTVKGMFLHWAYTTPFDIPFDAKEAFYEVPEGGMPAGIYNVKLVGINSSWDSYAMLGKTLQFEIAEDLPEGYQLVFAAAYDTADWIGTNVNIYESAKSLTAAATAVLSEGTEGTYLGPTDGNGEVNHIQKALVGYNRWSCSALRQWLNSSAGIGEWWEPQNKWDRAPSQLNKYPGFLSGYNEDIIAAMKTIQVKTACNTVTDGGVTDITYDKVFIPSLEEMNIAPQVSGIEGEAWEFFKQLFAAADIAATRTNWAQYGTYEELKSYSVSAKTAAQYARLRSDSRYNAIHTWTINPGGYVSTYYANTAYRTRPAFFI